MKLPNKLSALLRLAIKDLTKVEKQTKKYNINMSTWHETVTTEDGKSKCNVCFAGAVLANSCKTNIKKSINIRNFDQKLGIKTQAKMIALNELRIGQIDSAMGQLGNKTYQKYLNSNLPNSIRVIDYHNNKKRFKERMRKLAIRLAKAGF